MILEKVLFMEQRFCKREFGIVYLRVAQNCAWSRKSGIVDSRHREIFCTIQIFWNRGFASQRDLVDVPEFLELFIFVLHKIVPGPEILDHRCFNHSEFLCKFQKIWNC
jgi:hypothetical protein